MTLTIHHAAPALVGLLAGLLVGALYLRLLRRAVDRLLREQRPRALLLSAPLRLLLPPLVILALARWSGAAAIAGGVGLLLTQAYLRIWPMRQPS
ncbi:MAG: hypothetical protein IPK80_18070 [Nannocystis sp.]|nr:hypothetical protein [Nannocystis sp.]